jgi:hypothetical protein
MWGGVEDDVVGDVAQAAPQPSEGGAQGPTRGRDVGRSRVGEVDIVLAGQHQHLVGRSRPERTHHEHAIVGVHDPVVGGLLGLEGGAQQARSLEAPEPGFFLGDLPRHEGDAEQLAVGMHEARTGLAAVVHDHLRVADGRPARVVLQSVADGGHGHRRLGVVEVGPPGAVVGGEHQDLMDATAVRLCEHGAEVVHLQRLVAIEGRIAVGDDPDHPLALLAVGLQGRRRGFLVTGAEGARPVGIGFDREVGRDQVAGAHGAVDGDHDPAPREGIEAELAHLGGAKRAMQAVVVRSAWCTASTYRYPRAVSA